MGCVVVDVARVMWSEIFSTENICSTIWERDESRTKIRKKIFYHLILAMESEHCRFKSFQRRLERGLNLFSLYSFPAGRREGKKRLTE